MKYTNSLINQTSPYLLQHAHNPVNWVAWSDEIFQKAKAENKLILVSIGYSSCHWCHVMEKESFEDGQIASYMNEHFICIKVDREEHPDVDMVYMNAVQLMTQRGGWPLNCFTLPDGRPIYGGTYFQRENWLQVLKSLVHVFNNKLDEVLEYAEKLTNGIVQSEIIDQPEFISEFNNQKLVDLVDKWKDSFDLDFGGNNRAPKFPLPNNYQFLLRYSFSYKDQFVQKHVFNTLNKMAFGGIYDHLDGGFARYSVDMVWKVPHFEKMLYDNSQLLSLYADAYKVSKNELYKKVQNQIFDWLDQYMTSPFGSLYSAIDADSDGEEGMYYTWKKEELEEVLGEDFEFATFYYNIDEVGYWEETDKYILVRELSDSQLQEYYNIPETEFNETINRINLKLKERRTQRNFPLIDDKSLTSWNSMAIVGLLDSYEALSEKKFFLKAKEVYEWILKFQLNDDYSLTRNFKNRVSTIDGVLEDYTFFIQASLKMYRNTLNEKYLLIAKNTIDFTIYNFMDENSKMFYFTKSNTRLIARKMELNDNVIPSTNSVMANNLFEIGKILQNDDYLKIAKQMLSNVYEGMDYYGSGYSNWGILLMNYLKPTFETKVPSTNDLQNLLRHYFPGLIVLKNSSNDYQFCYDQHCELPQKDLSELINLVKSQYI